MIRLGIRAPLEFAPEAAALGYDYLELPLARIASLTADEFEELVAYLRSLDVRVDVLYDMLPSSIRVNGPDVSARVQHDWLNRAFARAGRLGASVIVFDAAQARGVPAGFDFAMARRQTGNFLRIVQGHAAPAGLKVAIQSYRRAECNLINTSGEAALITALLQLSCIGVLADTVQMAHASEPLDAIGRLGADLFHVHAGCALTRGLPRAGDGEDYARLFRTLARMGYNGRVSAVTDAEPDVEAAREALRCLKSARDHM